MDEMRSESMNKTQTICDDVFCVKKQEKKQMQG